MFQKCVLLNSNGQLHVGMHIVHNARGGGTSFSKLFSKLWPALRPMTPLLSFDGLKSQRALVAVLGKAH